MLLVGPTGAGKSFLARRVFELKRQRQQLQGRFIEVNCATLRGDSAIVGAVLASKGAFTGAHGRGRVCCVPPTVACSFSTKSANSV